MDLGFPAGKLWEASLMLYRHSYLEQEYSPKLEGWTISSAVIHSLLKELFLRTILTLLT